MELLEKEKFIANSKMCEPVKEEEVKDLIPIGEQMIKICLEKGGLGLAAPQIGIYKSMFVWMNTDESFQIVFNPTYYPDGKKTNVIEGCLSFPDESYYLQRLKEIRAVFYTYDGNKMIKNTKRLIGQKAFVFQHEAQHLSNITIADIGVLLEK